MTVIGLVGAGGFGRECMPLLEEKLNSGRLNAELVFVETTGAERRSVNGFDVLSEDEFFAHTSVEKYFNVAIGDGQVRRTIADRFVGRGARPISLISSDATIYHANEIGDGAILCAGSIVTSNARIGRFFHANLQSYVAHDCVIGEFVTFAPGVKCNGNVIIEDDVYVGTGVIIRNGSQAKPLRIGRGAVIGMGAVVTKDVPAGETWIGNPARKLER